MHFAQGDLGRRGCEQAAPERWRCGLAALPCPTAASPCLLPSRLVIYGQYCSAVELAISSLDNIAKMKEDVKLKLEVPAVCVCACVYVCVYRERTVKQWAPFHDQCGS